jgi:hypothetical protein
MAKKITVKEEGITISESVRVLNFIGAGSTASGDGSLVSINIPEGATNYLSTALTALVGSANHVVVTISGHTTVGDGGGGQARWFLGSTTPADNGTVWGAGSGRWKRIYSGDINVKWFGATGDGVTEEYTAFLNAVAAAQAAKVNLYVPKGYYQISTTLRIVPADYTELTVFGRVPGIYGDGIGSTVFFTGVSNGPMFDIDAQSNPVVTFKGILGGFLRDFTIRKVASATTAGTGIKIRAAYHFPIDNIHIRRMSGNGIWIPDNYGDNDACIMVSLRNIRIEGCVQWGIKADSDVGFNEQSFLNMEHVFIVENGTTSGTLPPPSGGMLYKGQVLKMDNCAFTTNENVALFIRGESGLGSNIDIQGTTFENGLNKQVYCTGVNLFKMRNCQFYQQQQLCPTGIWFDATTYQVAEVEIVGTFVRTSAFNSPHTTFRVTGTNVDLDKVRVKGSVWSEGDYPGHIKFDGIKFPTVPMLCKLVFLNDEIIRLNPTGAGNAMPLRNASSQQGNTDPVDTGEWYETNILTSEIALSGPTSLTLIEGGAVASSTRYNCYFYDDLGNRKIGLSATTPTIDTVSGYYVRTGDVAKLWIGAVTSTSAASPNQRWSHVENSNEGLIGSVIYDPGNLSDGAGVTTTILVIGAVLGDFTLVTFSLNLQGITLASWVSSDDNVSVRFQNETGGSIDLASGVLRAQAKRS